MKKTNLKNMVQIYENDVRAGTFIIADGFQRDHRKIVDVIRKHRNMLETFGLILDRKSKSEGGRPTVEYMLNEGQTIFLGSLLKNTEVVIAFKLKIAHAFIVMRDALAKIRYQKNDPEYIRARIEGKSSRRLETIILSDLIPYSVAQGSQGYAENPENCYINYTQMTNVALFNIEEGFKKVREHLDKKQLRQVAVAEDIIADSIIELMAADLHYKEIYTAVKDKIEIYSEVIGKSKVPSIDMPKQLVLF